MTASAALLDTLTIEAYAREAFSLDPDSPTGFGEGGVYAGPLHHAPGAKPESDLAGYMAPGNEEITARARLLPVAPGKVMVRWADARTLGNDGAAAPVAGRAWTAAASGIWWVTDNMADHIVRETVRRSGPYGDTSVVAREHSQVKVSWSTMTAVVVCRVTRPIKVLIGVGRPVPGVASLRGRDELQVVMLTRISSPQDKHRKHFIGDQFLECMFFSTSAAFTAWWQQKGFVERRRSSLVSSLRGR